jgi:MULE transposase domain
MELTSKANTKVHITIGFIADLGILLSATAEDANGCLFPLAYAVVSAENDDNWFWFNQHLRIVIEQHAPVFLVPQSLAFISDRQKGLLEGVERNFPNSPHGYCLRHLYENMYKEFKHPQLKTFLWQAARATTEEDYNVAMSGLKGISERAHTWLLKHAHPRYWAELYFQGRRYGHFTSNIAESLNAAILEARDKPILGMFEHIRHQLMDWFSKRRQIDSNVPQGQIIVSQALKQIQDLTAWQARRFRLLPCSETEAEVFSLERSITYSVNLLLRSCTCF